MVTGEVEIKRDDGTTDIIRTLLRPLPRNGGSVRLLICPNCQIPRRGLYGWEPGGRFNTSVVRSNWRCRACRKLRYASEGGARLWFMDVELSRGCSAAVAVTARNRGFPTLSQRISKVSAKFSRR